MADFALTGAALHDGVSLLAGHALCVAGDRVEAIRAAADLPATLPRRALPPGMILPGFVDLQVNGGGGLMFNARPEVDTLRVMAEAHGRFGTRAFLPTVITDTPQKTAAAIRAVRAAVAQSVPGVIGLHLEGPHLAPARKGAHDGTLIRPMNEDDLIVMEMAARDLPNLLVTVAPESATEAQVARLVAAGAAVSLGHSDCTHDTAMRFADAGAGMVTHLHNAMSPMTTRAPGLVGAVLSDGRLRAGVIADGHHVHPATLRASLAAMGPARLFLVTDAMATVGASIAEFALNGRRILRAEGRLTLEDGTLAGADIDMWTSVRRLVQLADVPLETAIAMATGTPASGLPHPQGVGGLVGQRMADLLWLATDGTHPVPVPTG